jgi:hypothetical protein
MIDHTQLKRFTKLRTLKFLSRRARVTQKGDDEIIMSAFLKAIY